MAQVIGGRWEIVEKIGEGGQGETFTVVDKNDPGEKYALKRLKNVSRLPRFQKEVETIRSLDHPNILKLVDADVAAKKPYLVSEFCRRRSLEDNKTQLFEEDDRDDRFAIFEQICDALAVAHEQGVVHRDIKPSNVFLRDNGDAVLGDFGLCFVEADERITETLEAVGARYYMAPELAEGRADSVTPRSDVYSMGKLLYWLMAGRVFDRERHREGRNYLENFYRSDESVEHLHRLLDRMVVEQPQARFKDASAVRGELPNLRRLLRGGYPSLSAYPQLCKYCGNGMYKGLPSDSTTLYNFGIRPTGSSNLHIFICENCGHVLMFRDDMSKNPGWPSKESKRSG